MSKKILMLILLFGFSSFVPLLGDTFVIDPNRSQVRFSIRHWVHLNFQGHFTEFRGWLKVDPKKLKLEQVQGFVRSDSVNAGVPGDQAQAEKNRKEDSRFDYAKAIMGLTLTQKLRELHLKNEDFFWTARFPEMVFSSTAIEEHENQLVVVGNLTIRGVTRQVTLYGEGNRGLLSSSGLHIHLKAEGQIDRRDFEMGWNKRVKTGAILLGNDVTIHLDIIALKNNALTKPIH